MTTAYRRAQTPAITTYTDLATLLHPADPLFAAGLLFAYRQRNSLADQRATWEHLQVVVPYLTWLWMPERPTAVALRAAVARQCQLITRNVTGKG